MSHPSTIFVVDDDPAVRDSLKFMLESAGHCVEAYANARDMLDRAGQPLAGCLVADLRLPGMSGLDMVDKLTENGTDLPVIVITGHGDVDAAVRALKAGCVDFIQKPFSDQSLLERVGKALEQDHQRRCAAEEHANLCERYDRLTPREKEVMALVVAGKLNKQVAAELNLSSKTIEVHRSNAMTKMGARSFADLVRMAIALDEMC